MPSMTINYTSGEGARFATVIGKALNLKDGNGSPRDATAAECKTFVINTMKQVMTDIEAAQIQKDAAAAAAIPAFQPT